MLSAVEELVSLRDLGHELVSAWLNENLKWWTAKHGGEGIGAQEPHPAATGNTKATEVPKDTSPDGRRTAAKKAFADFAGRMERLRRASEKNAERVSDIDMWLRSLVVMTAPYLGLPEEVALPMRDAILGIVDATSRAELGTTEAEMVDNAILDGQTGAVGPDSDFDAFVERFAEGATQADRVCRDLVESLPRAEGRGLAMSSVHDRWELFEPLLFAQALRRPEAFRAAETIATRCATAIC